MVEGRQAGIKCVLTHCTVGMEVVSVAHVQPTPALAHSAGTDDTVQFDSIGSLLLHRLQVPSNTVRSTQTALSSRLCVCRCDLQSCSGASSSALTSIKHNLHALAVSDAFDLLDHVLLSVQHNLAAAVAVAQQSVAKWTQFALTMRPTGACGRPVCWCHARPTVGAEPASLLGHCPSADVS